MTEKITTKNAPAAIGPYSQAVMVDGTLYTSGQIALDPETGDMVGTTTAEQTEQVMKNLSAVLDAAGCGFDDVIKTTCFLADMADFAQFNEIYGRYMTSCPARSCIAAAALPKGALVEVEVIAKAK